MATPVVAGVGRTGETTAVSSHALNLPASIASGDLLIGWMSCLNNADRTHTWPGDWTQLIADVADGTSSKISFYYKFAAGTETGTITVTTSGGGLRATAHIYRITGAHASTPPEAGSNTDGSGTTPNPPSKTVSWGADTNLWIAVEEGNDQSKTVSSYPSSYTNGIQDVTTGTGTETGSAYLGTSNATENPGTFTMSGALRTISVTIGVRPAAAGGATTRGMPFGNRSTAFNGGRPLAGIIR